MKIGHLSREAVGGGGPRGVAGLAIRLGDGGGGARQAVVDIFDTVGARIQRGKVRGHRDFGEVRLGLVVEKKRSLGSDLVDSSTAGRNAGQVFFTENETDRFDLELRTRSVGRKATWRIADEGKDVPALIV